MTEQLFCECNSLHCHEFIDVPEEACEWHRRFGLVIIAHECCRGPEEDDKPVAHFTTFSLYTDGDSSGATNHDLYKFERERKTNFIDLSIDLSKILLPSGHHPVFLKSDKGWTW